MRALRVFKQIEIISFGSVATFENALALIFVFEKSIILVPDLVF